MKPIPKKNLTQDAFTLIELLVVISIIALLSSIIFSVASISRAKGRDGKRITEIDNLITALNLEYQNKGHYPCHPMFDTSASGGFLEPLVTDGFLADNFQDPTNVDPIVYGYGTYNSKTGAKRTRSSCGAIAYIWFTSEQPIQGCPGGGLLYESHHCHIFLNGPPPCADYDDADVNVADRTTINCNAVDTYSEY